jgi:hypothetical protein
MSMHKLVIKALQNELLHAAAPKHQVGEPLA